MKKVLALILAVALVAALGVTSAFAKADVKEFWEDGDGYYYDLTFNYGDDPTVWGGMDGIGDKTPPKDTVIHYRGVLGFTVGEIERMGYILGYGEENEMDPVWVEANMDDAMNAVDSIGQTAIASILAGIAGDYGITYHFDIDTSALPEGTWNLAIVADVEGQIYEVGTRSEAYGGGMFKTTVISSGINYVEPTEAPATDVPTEAPVTEEPTEEATEVPAATDVPAEEATDAPAAPTKAPEEKKGCGSAIASGVAVIALAGAALFIKKKD